MENNKVTMTLLANTEKSDFRHLDFNEQNLIFCDLSNMVVTEWGTLKKFEDYNYKINLTKIKEFYKIYKKSKIDIKEVKRLLIFLSITKRNKFLDYVLKDLENDYKKQEKIFNKNGISFKDFIEYYTDYKTLIN